MTASSLLSASEAGLVGDGVRGKSCCSTPPSLLSTLEYADSAPGDVSRMRRRGALPLLSELVSLVRPADELGAVPT